jgi:hypothetical protein
MMSFAQHFQDGPPKKEIKCAIAELIKDLRNNKKNADADGLEQIIEAIRQTRNTSINSKNVWTGMALFRIIRSEGHNISRSTLERHLGLTCSCRD